MTDHAPITRAETIQILGMAIEIMSNGRINLARRQLVELLDELRAAETPPAPPTDRTPHVRPPRHTA